MGELTRADDAPWKERFRAASIIFSSIARNEPGNGLAITNKDGLYQAYAWEVNSGRLSQRSSRPEGLISAAISPDGKFIYYLDDEAGNEVGHYVRVPFGGGDPEDITHSLPAYNPGFPFMSPLGLAFSRAGNRLAFTAGLDDGFHVYVMDSDENGMISEPREIYHCEPLISAPVLSHSGEILVIASTERHRQLQFSLIAFDAVNGERIAELHEGDEISVTPLFFSPTDGDMRIAGLTNRSGVERLILWDPVADDLFDPSLQDAGGAVNAFDWSSDGGRILFRTFNDAVQQLYVYDVANDQSHKVLHPSGTNFGPYFSPEGDIHSHLATATSPSRLVVLDEAGGIRTTLLTAGEVPDSHPWKSIRFRSGGSQPIQAWLATPKGEGPFPLIMETHGGPQSVQAESFVPKAQAWVDHGFAWTSVNYRGSTTFGKEFEESIWGNPGELEVEDMVAARQYLVDQGIAIPNQVLLTGWSYGGYLTLQALGKYPELWAGGLAGIAIADWTLLYEDAAESLKKYCVALFGGTPQELPDQYAKSSPITYAHDVQAPVLIVQGRNDTRTPSRPIEIYEQKMKSLGKKIEVHWFDTGHLGPFAHVEQAIEHHELMLRAANSFLMAREA